MVSKGMGVVPAILITAVKTEALALETAPFGVKVTALEPGGMRTNWGKRASTDIPAVLPDYEPSLAR